MEWCRGAMPGTYVVPWTLLVATRLSVAFGGGADQSLLAEGPDVRASHSVGQPLEVVTWDTAKQYFAHTNALVPRHLMNPNIKFWFIFLNVLV